MARVDRTAGVRWWLQRVTAVLLALGLLVHFVVLHFMTSRPVNFDAVAARLRDPWWVAFDLALLGLVLWHGLNGLYGVLLDYAPGVASRRLAMWVLWIAGIAAFFFGVAIIAPFTGRA